MEFNFSHISDIHLGSYQGKVEAGGINSRFIDFVNTLKEAVDYTILNKMNFCLITGDIFRTKQPEPSELDAFSEEVKRLMDANIPLYILLGNHDLFLSEKLKHSISALKTLKLKNVHIIDSISTLKININGEDVQLQCMPYQHRNILKLKTHEEVSKYMEQKIEEEYNKLDLNKPIIFAGHFSVQDSVYGTEQKTINRFAEPIISKSIFYGKKYLYVALGHLHRYQKVLDNPLTYYAGSINRIDFNECDEDKGFNHVRVKDSKVGAKFIKVNARKFINVEYDLTKEEEPQQKMLENLESIKDSLKDAIVRVKVSISEDKKSFYDTKEITEFLNNSCYYIHGTCSPHVVKKDKVEDSHQYSELLNPIEALKIYSNTNDKIKDKERFLKIGQSIINEVLMSNK